MVLNWVENSGKSAWCFLNNYSSSGEINNGVVLSGWANGIPGSSVWRAHGDRNKIKPKQKLMEEMEEKEIIHSCLQGDRESFKRIVEMYKAQAMAIAMNILGNREDAEDVCQETFLQVFQCLGQFDQKRSFKNWLLTILYRRCLDQTKKAKRFRRFFERFKREAAVSPSAPILPFSVRQSYPSNALASLSPKEKLAVTLWANEGYSAEEISSILGCRPSTARVYLFNARKKIKALLEK